MIQTQVPQKLSALIKPLLFLVIFCVVAPGTYAQSDYSVQGSVVDTTSALTLKNAVVKLLRAKDSIYVDFERADVDGRFRFSSLDSGEYILVASYPKYADFVERFELGPQRPMADFGTINLFLLSQLLNEVVITGRNAITIKGDTIEFDASKYTIQPNSRVEDLLAQLPGIQVDLNGRITAQGEAVNRVLVDGEEFFGDDPTLVTRNIRGDMVDKVQLYGQKSDQATFTGIDDGAESKTINIQLKEDSRHGWFGKVEGGLAKEDHQDAQVMFNRFKGDRKFAAYGTISNTGKTGLGWQDSERFVGWSSQMEGMMDQGSTADLDSYSGEYRGQGLPFARNAGVHYDTKWNDRRESINTNYKIGDMEITGDRNTISQISLPDGLLNTQSDEQFDNDASRQKADLRYEVAFDSSSTLIVEAEGMLSRSRLLNDYQSQATDGTDNLLNRSERRVNNEGDSESWAVQALWNKRLKRNGRTLSVRVTHYSSANDVTGLLYSRNEFFGEGGATDSTQLIDQRKMSHRDNSLSTASLVYTEPLSAFFKLGVNYRFLFQRSLSSLFSYNRSPGQEYNDLDSLFSNDFKLNQLSNSVGATLSFVKNRQNLSASFEAADVRFKQADRFQGNDLQRNFLNFNPALRWTYAISDQKSVNFNYLGATNQPSISQIQPLRSNEDPLNIAVGNPNLDPSFTHEAAMSYRAARPMSGQFFSLSLNGTAIGNAIVRNVMTNEAGKSIYSYENRRDKTPVSMSAEVYYGRNIGPINAGSRLSHSRNEHYNVINETLNNISTHNTSLNLSLGRNEEAKYSFIFEGGPSYHADASSLQANSSSKGWGFNGFLGVRLYLPGSIEVRSNNSFEYAEATQVFVDDFERLLLNLTVSKAFLPSKELVVSIHGNDLLNQNSGFSRTAYSTGFMQTDYTTIRRYFMLSVKWDFSRMGNTSN